MSHELKKIFFVENFHGMQYFLSIVDPKEENLIITNGNRHLERFLDDILPRQERIAIPRIPCYRFFILPLLLLYWRIKYSRILSKKHVQDAYFFSRGNNIHYFAVFRKLQRCGCALHFIDGSGGKFAEDKIFEDNYLQKFYNKILSLCCGQELIRYQCWAWKHFGLKEFSAPQKIHVLDWERIAGKFGFSMEKANNAVLIVDGPIQDIPGVNISKTQENIASYFSKHVEKEIHLKPHLSYDHNSFSGATFEKRLRILPRHIPAELVMLRYVDIYFFSSAACYGQKDKKLYSLSNLLIFESAEAETNYWKLFNDYYHSETVAMPEIKATQLHI